MDITRPEVNEKPIDLEALRKQLYQVLFDIKKNNPELCDLDSLKHQIFIYNKLNSYIDFHQDEVAAGPFLNLNFFNSGEKHISGFLKNNLITFGVDKKTLVCCPQVLAGQLFLLYYETK